jgi:two-component system NtrC family sensor kinase
MLRHLAQRFIVPLAVIVVAVAAFSGLYTSTSEERQMLRMMRESADQLSRSITSATWHAMLADRRDDAYQVMETIAQKQGIDRIRVFNRNGQLTFSSRAEEIRHQSDRTVESCSGCHVSALPLQQMDLASRSQILRQGDGRRSLDVVTPIFNEPSCSQAACHAHPESVKVIGLLDVQLSLANVDAELSNMQLRVLVRVLVEFALITLFIVIFTRRFVTQPIHRLVESAQAISNMDLDRPVQATDGSLELSRLSRAFELMRVSLRSQRDEITQFTQTLESKVEERSRQLQAAQQKLQHNDRLASLGTLAASVAHEINNPISGVLNLGMLMQRILKDDGIPAARVPEFRRYLGQVVHETSRVGRIVSDLLSFSRRGKPQRLPADLNKLIRSTASLVDHQLKLANIGLDLRLTDPLPLVDCDGSQIQQVVLNLILNAAEAMHERGAGTVTVETVPRTWNDATPAAASRGLASALPPAASPNELPSPASPGEASSSASLRDAAPPTSLREASAPASRPPAARGPAEPPAGCNAIALVVRDTGEGIPPELVSRIFDPFFTTKPDGKGVGLGLAVSYGIVQAHGGEIEVRSQPGAGTEFTVILPLSPREPPRATAASSGVPASDAASSAAPRCGAATPPEESASA